MKAKTKGDRLYRLAGAYYTAMVDARDTMRDLQSTGAEKAAVEETHAMARREFHDYMAIRETIRTGYMPVKECE